MATIITRSGKGSPLTNTEVDNNFTNLNSDKLESGDTVASLTLTSADINGGTIDGTVIGGSTPAAISGTTGSFSGNLTVDTNTLFVDAANNRVGVGTSSPQARLHVFNDQGGGSGRILIDANVTSGYNAKITATDVGLEFTTVSNSRSFLFNTGSTPTERMRITYNGDISFYEDTGTTPKFFWDASAESLGIGTSAPNNKAQVSYTSVAAVPSAGAGGHGFAVGDSGFGIAAGALTSGNGYLQATRWDGSATNYNLILQPNGGNVGIGTSSPTADLSVGSATSSSGDVHLRTSKTTFELTPNNSDAGGMDINVGFVAGGQGPLKFSIGGTERMRIDSSGNLGLGVVPSAWASFTAMQIGDTGCLASNAFSSSNTQTFFGNNVHYDGAYKYIATGSEAAQYIQLGSEHRWNIAPSGTAANAISFTQAMTLDASGNLLVGTTDVAATAGAGVKLYSGTDGSIAVVGATSTSTNSTYALYSTGAGAFRFYVTYSGAIHATSTSITAISDASLKENIRDLETGLGEVMALRPRRFDWKNGDGENVAGFIAQEVEAILPELVYDYKYNEAETKKALKMGDILPTLVKAIQELKAEVDSLRAQLNH